jgi:hypothetical protein
MLLRIAEDVRQCLEHAAEASERARRQPDPERKAEFLAMERHWLRLAESYRLVEQLELFILEGKRQMRQSLLRRIGALEKANARLRNDAKGLK